MARQKPKSKAAVDFSLLSDDDKLALANEAKLLVREEKRKVAEDAYREQMLADERREAGIEEELLTSTLNLAEQSDRVVLDGRVFMHGLEYTLPRSVWQVLKEVESRTWYHYGEVKEGKSRLAQGPRAQHQNIGLSPHGVVNTSQLMRA